MADSNGERSHERPQLDHCCLRYAERLLVDEDRHLIELAWSREHPASGLSVCLSRGEASRRRSACRRRFWNFLFSLRFLDTCDLR
jgi:hypothetical protein